MFSRNRITWVALAIVSTLGTSTLVARAAALTLAAAAGSATAAIVTLGDVSPSPVTSDVIRIGTSLSPAPRIAIAVPHPPPSASLA